MDKSLEDELEELARASPADQTLTKAARLRAVLPKVEAALRAGTTHAVIVERLKNHGLDMTVAVFGTTLHRLRARAPLVVQDQAEQKPAPPALPAPSAPPPVLKQLGNRAEPADMEALINHGRKKS